MAFIERKLEELENLIERFNAFGEAKDGALFKDLTFHSIFIKLRVCRGVLNGALLLKEADLEKNLQELRATLVEISKGLNDKPKLGPFKDLFFETLILLARYWPLNKTNAEGNYLDYFNQNEVIAYNLPDSMIGAEHALIPTASGLLLKKSDFDNFYKLGKAYRLREDKMHPLNIFGGQFLDRREAVFLIENGVTIFKPDTEMRVDKKSNVAIDQITPALESAVSIENLSRSSEKGFVLAAVFIGIPVIIGLFVLSMFVAPPFSPLLLSTLVGTSLATAAISRKDNFWRDCFESLATNWMLIMLVSVVVPTFLPGVLTSSLLGSVASSLATDIPSLILSAVPLVFLGISGIVDGLLGRMPGVTLHRDIFEFFTSIVMTATGMVGATAGFITGLLHNMTRAPLTAPSVASIDDFPLPAAAAVNVDAAAMNALEKDTIKPNMGGIQRKLKIPFNLKGRFGEDQAEIEANADAATAKIDAKLGLDALNNPEEEDNAALENQPLTVETDVNVATDEDAPVPQGKPLVLA